MVRIYSAYVAEGSLAYTVYTCRLHDFVLQIRTYIYIDACRIKHECTCINGCMTYIYVCTAHSTLGIHVRRYIQ